MILLGLASFTSATTLWASWTLAGIRPAGLQLALSSRGVRQATIARSNSRGVNRRRLLGATGSARVGAKWRRGNLLTFGLSADQEDRFRQAHLGSDLAQARTSIVPVVAAVVLFAVNDYSFLGLSWPFYAVQAVRLGLVAYTIVLLKRLRTLTRLFFDLAFGLPGHFFVFD